VRGRACHSSCVSMRSLRAVISSSALNGSSKSTAQVDFILERLAESASTPAILEANGGATVWGTRGFVKTIEYAQLLEEGAQFQQLAETLGGSKPFGPGVLEQQFALSGLTEQARAAGRLE